MYWGAVPSRYPCHLPGRGSSPDFRRGRVTHRSTGRVVYVATGERHIREAAASLESLWRNEPGTPVTMYVDRPSRRHLRAWGIPTPSRFDRLEVIDHPDPTYTWTDKPIALSQGDGGHERVLFLDTDTRVCGSIAEIFEMLDSFVLAAAHAPIRLDRRQPAFLARRVPGAFPELNTGVIAFRRTASVQRMLERWRLMHLEILRSIDTGSLGDQATFRVALYDSDVRFTVLPPEYNCRFTFPTYVHGPVRILHGRSPDLEGIEREVNGTSGPRVFVPGVGILKAWPDG
jgi:hypothetical protein